MTQRVGLIGFGGIGQSILQAWAAEPPLGYSLAALLVRPQQREAARWAAGPHVLIADTVEAFLGGQLDIVIEAAGQGAVRDYAEPVLRAGAELHVISTGALADAGCRERIFDLAQQGNGRLVIPVGATAGLDGLLAMRQDGLLRVTYTSTKPPQAWKGTPAEADFDLDNLLERRVIFSGPADQAALLYPKNANLAATVALAGLGFTETRVELVADPAANGNTGRIDAESRHSQLTVIVSGRASQANPKTSAITGMSVLSALKNRAGWLSFG
ncbi:aspartate dehydrogenase [Ferrovibrio sp.]|uniref:aspartate dehydrogenase n=1 Tax=Ferrovibrio sp. TaxID=1917215 RepID=UPI003D271C19